MIDENSHYSQQTEVRESNLFSLRKRAPIESLLTSTGIASSFSSQEPRRPRFSFFHLHNVKELTSKSCSAGSTSVRATALKTGEQNPVRFPGARPCPVRNAEQWERNSLGVVSVAGCRPDISVCQHPIFNFQNTRKPKLENTKSPVLSRACFSLQHLPAPPSSAMGGLYGPPQNLSTGERNKTVILCTAHPATGPVRVEPIDSTRARDFQGACAAPLAL